MVVMKKKRGEEKRANVSFMLDGAALPWNSIDMLQAPELLLLTRLPLEFAT